MPSAADGISINRFGAFGTRVSDRSRWPSRCATPWDCDTSTWPISTRSRAAARPATSIEGIIAAGAATSGSTRACEIVDRLAPLLDLDPARTGSSSDSRASRARRSWRRSSSGSVRIARSSASTCSTDVRGSPRGAAWTSEDPFEIAAQAIELRRATAHPARPGAGRDGPRDRAPRTCWPELREASSRGRRSAWAGGSRGIEEVADAEGAGASAVLVGSAIHDGRIGRRELERIAAASDEMASRSGRFDGSPPRHSTCGRLAEALLDLDAEDARAGASLGPSSPREAGRRCSRPAARPSCWRSGRRAHSSRGKLQ